MNRRDFMRRMFGTAVTVAVNPGIVLSPRLASDKLHGIDWGLNDGTVGTWMGITRSDKPIFTSSWVHPPNGINPSTIQAIRRMIDKAKEHYEKELILTLHPEMKKILENMK